MEINIHPDALMNSLRIAALQGELSPHSAAPSSARGTFTEPVERLLMRISVLEDCPIDKLRGWLLRVPGFDPHAKGNIVPAGGLGRNPFVRTPTYSNQPSARSFGSANDSGTPQIRAHFGSGGNRRGSGWDVGPVASHASGSLAAFPSGNVRSAIDAARW